MSESIAQADVVTAAESGTRRQVAKHAGITFAGLMAANVLGYVFYTLVSRALGVEAYGTFSSLVAIVLIVDQNQVDRVQTAFNNSKLRFLTTQVLLNHYPKSLKPELPTEKAGDEKGRDCEQPGNAQLHGIPPERGSGPAASAKA